MLLVIMKKNWVFALYNEFKKLKNQKYRVFIDSEHFNGKMHYAEIVNPGKSKKRNFFLN